MLQVRSPYANPISTIVPAINRVRSATRWDRVVFTLDWLPPAMQRTFCLADSAGAGLLADLELSRGGREATGDQDAVFFKKDSDDSFCDVRTIPYPPPSHRVPSPHSPPLHVSCVHASHV